MVYKGVVRCGRRSKTNAMKHANVEPEELAALGVGMELDELCFEKRRDLQRGRGTETVDGLIRDGVGAVRNDQPLDL